MPSKRATARAAADENVDLSLRLAPFFRPLLADLGDSTDDAGGEDQPDTR